MEGLGPNLPVENVSIFTLIVGSWGRGKWLLYRIFRKLGLWKNLLSIYAKSEKACRKKIYLSNLLPFRIFLNALVL